MPNDRISPLDIVLGNILGEESPSKPDQKAVSFRIDFDNYVSLCALQSITPKGVSRNQLLNDLWLSLLIKLYLLCLMVFQMLMSIHMLKIKKV